MERPSGRLRIGDIIPLEFTDSCAEHCGTLSRRTNQLQGVSVPALRRAFLPVAVVLIFSHWVQPSAASPGDGGIQRLPVIEKQDIRFEALSVGGKPFQKRVLALAQDNYGFLWLGTDDGLYRYDGYSLRQYSHDPGKPTQSERKHGNADL